MKGKTMKDIYTDNITIETGEVITNILEVRKKALEQNENTKQPASEAQVHPIINRSVASNTVPFMYYLDMD